MTSEQQSIIFEYIKQNAFQIKLNNGSSAVSKLKLTIDDIYNEAKYT